MLAVAAVILFDISGFFDNLNVDRLVHIVSNLGFPPSITAWLRSFLTDRTIRITFNGSTSESFNISHGTPQGSPLSPILSALYTSPLLKLVNRTWSLRGLNTYVDGGAIVATSATHHSAAHQAASWSPTGSIKTVLRPIQINLNLSPFTNASLRVLTARFPTGSP